MNDTSPHDTSGGAASANTVTGRSGNAVGPSGSQYIIVPLQKASEPRKKEKTAMSHFWDAHHTTRDARQNYLFRSSARCGSTFVFRKNGFVRCAASSVFLVTFSVRGEVCSLCASSCHVALSGVVFVVSSRRGSKHAENMSVMAGTRSMGSYVEGVGGGGLVSCWGWACRPGVRRAPSVCFFAEWSRRRPPLSVQCLRQLGSSMGCSAGQDGVVSDSMHVRWFFLMS